MDEVNKLTAKFEDEMRKMRESIEETDNQHDAEKIVWQMRLKAERREQTRKHDEAISEQQQEYEDERRRQ